jgi:undecaprenyl-diphosphatase
LIALPPILEESADFAALTLLALVQGLTEFLPVSSSGHLVLTQTALGFEEPAMALDIALHVGTLLAVVTFYHLDLLRICRQALGGKFREIGLLGLATLPTALVGVLFKDQIQSVFHDSRFASGGLLLTAAILMIGEWARRKRADSEQQSEELERDMGWGQAFLIGCAQTVAILPGISRSGSTIVAGMLLGLPAQQAARFSFLISIPAILGAAVLSLPDAIDDGLVGGVGPVVWAVLFAGFIGWGALRMLLAFLGRGAFAWFAVYCVVLGSGSFLFL